jgi:RNA polymerase sigma-70 factor (ECF subfamily)
MNRLPPAQPDVDVYSSMELWVRAREGDSGALNRLFARYLPRLHRWAHGRVPTWARDGADTADFVQETVLHTLRRLDAFEPQREGALMAYLRRALLNRIRITSHSQIRPHTYRLSWHVF